MVKDVLNQKYDNCLVWEEEAAPQRVKFGPRGFSEVDAEDFNRRLLEARGCTGAFDIREPTVSLSGTTLKGSLILHFHSRHTHVYYLLPFTSYFRLLRTLCFTTEVETIRR